MNPDDDGAGRLLALVYGAVYSDLSDHAPGLGELNLAERRVERLAAFDHDYLGWHLLLLDFDASAAGDALVVLVFVDWIDRDVYRVDSWPWAPRYEVPWVAAALHVARYRRTHDPSS